MRILNVTSDIFIDGKVNGFSIGMIVKTNTHKFEPEEWVWRIFPSVDKQIW